MNTMEAMANRRSIRKYRETPVPRDLVERVLAAALQAPSGKNRQPWRFVALEGSKKDELVEIMRAGIRRLQEYGVPIGSAEWTADIMVQAPVAILIFNAEAAPGTDHSGVNRYPWLVDIQSIGAAIQHILLAATELGLGSLWICDIFCADYAIQEWLGRGDELVAAVSLGYPAEAPEARPRKEPAELVAWLS